MPKKFNPAPFRERMGFAQVVDVEEGFHESFSLVSSSAQSILEQVDFSGPPIKGAKVDFLAKRTGPIGAALSKKVIWLPNVIFCSAATRALGVCSSDE